jgi:putative colanic acid biosynthesis acetyltransferase WcaB
MDIQLHIFQDWKNNQHNTKGKIVCTCFRIAGLSTKNLFFRVILFPYLILYKIIFEWIIGIELPYKLKVGRGLCIYHLQAIVINKNTVIGENFTMRHSLTIGNKDEVDTKCPVIGNNVSVGCQCLHNRGHQDW